eukprot:CAMPEP_0170613834 /NCGR_PEP_ID=MMETSP0224-20130122/24481_1 /TAXON_ID=285029 /ORGANISM="Togula jolla, Strain CCCM 725" /LENGTH=125 /DNA_ID=CAMNT_0010939457 /DNA_START=190 /DNA_END=568 /DNA_ORIENTATION=-
MNLSLEGRRGLAAIATAKMACSESLPAAGFPEQRPTSAGTMTALSTSEEGNSDTLTALIDIIASMGPAERSMMEMQTVSENGSQAQQLENYTEQRQYLDNVTHALACTPRRWMVRADCRSGYFLE